MNSLWDQGVPGLRDTPRIIHDMARSGENDREGERLSLLLSSSRELGSKLIALARGKEEVFSEMEVRQSEWKFNELKEASDNTILAENLFRQAIGKPERDIFSPTSFDIILRNLMERFVRWKIANNRSVDVAWEIWSHLMRHFPELRDKLNDRLVMSTLSAYVRAFQNFTEVKLMAQKTQIEDFSMRMMDAIIAFGQAKEWFRHFHSEHATFQSLTFEKYIMLAVILASKEYQGVGNVKRVRSLLWYFDIPPEKLRELGAGEPGYPGLHWRHPTSSDKEMLDAWCTLNGIER